MAQEFDVVAFDWFVGEEGGEDALGLSFVQVSHTRHELEIRVCSPLESNIVLTSIFHNELELLLSSHNVICNTILFPSPGIPLKITPLQTK